jgi:hypothetical protein
MDEIKSSLPAELYQVLDRSRDLGGTPARGGY